MYTGLHYPAMLSSTNTDPHCSDLEAVLCTALPSSTHTTPHCLALHSSTHTALCTTRPCTALLLRLFMENEYCGGEWDNAYVSQSVVLQVSTRVSQGVSQSRRVWSRTRFVTHSHRWWHRTVPRCPSLALLSWSTHLKSKLMWGTRASGYELDDSLIGANYSFKTREQISRLCVCYRIPAFFVIPEAGYRFNGQELLLISLERCALGSRYLDLQQKYHVQHSVICRGIIFFAKWMNENSDYLLFWKDY
jgi:hypothetical protein